MLTEALSLNRSARPKGTLAVAEALPVLGVEKYIRMDFKQYAIKHLGGNFAAATSAVAIFGQFDVVSHGIIIV